jgi:hypothetical protein
MPQKEGKCIYCSSDGPLTREHVFSDWIKRKFGNMESEIATLPGKRLQSLLKQKDVCAACNNGSLSTLDDYAKNLGLHDPSASGEPLNVERDVLARYVLKCGYNNARINLRLADSPTLETTKTANEFSRFAPFILGASDPPYPIDLLAAEFKFTKTVAAGAIDMLDELRCVVFNSMLFLGWGCFLILGWVDGIQEVYRRDSIRVVCDKLNMIWVRDEYMRLPLKPLAPPPARLPDGTVLPLRA